MYETKGSYNIREKRKCPPKKHGGRGMSKRPTERVHKNKSWNNLRNNMTNVILDYYPK